MLLSCVRFKRVPDPVYVLTAFAFSNGYYVKSARLFSPVRVVGQKPRGCARDFLLFMACHGFCTTAMPAGFTEFDLHENEGRLILHDQVDFAKPAGVVPVQRPQAL